MQDTHCNTAEDSWSSDITSGCFTTLAPHPFVLLSLLNRCFQISFRAIFSDSEILYWIRLQMMTLGKVALQEVSPHCRGMTQTQWTDNRYVGTWGIVCWFCCLIVPQLLSCRQIWECNQFNTLFWFLPAFSRRSGIVGMVEGKKPHSSCVGLMVRSYNICTAICSRMCWLWDRSMLALDLHLEQTFATSATFWVISSFLVHKKQAQSVNVAISIIACVTYQESFGRGNNQSVLQLEF